MAPRKQIDTGGLPFNEIRRRDKYYVDKTLLIKDILGTNDSGIYLYTRPRRFGKSTNITMLDAFFNLQYKGNDWFDGLSISEFTEYERYKNSFPVILLNLKDTVPNEPVDTFEDFVERMGKVLSDLFMRFDYLLDSDRVNPRDKAVFDTVLYMKAGKAMLVDAIRDLTRMLRDHHGVGVVLLIDEYDRAVTDTYDSELRDPILGFLSLMLTGALKDNPCLQMAYITGITQVAKAGMFSGLNNLTVNNVFSRMSDERFGFTEAEVREILEYYGRPDRLDEVRSWYDGYRFGDVEVYNPFSVMSYVSNDFTPEPYWVKTSKLAPIKRMLQRVGLDSIGEIANLVNGNVSECSLHATMTFDELSLSVKEDLYSLMVMTGYINAVPKGDGVYELSIPNREVLSETNRLLEGNVRISGDLLSRFNTALAEGDAETMASVLQEVLCDASYFDLRDETSYELIILTMMHDMLGGYDVRAQPESGNGRADLVMTGKTSGSPTIIMELKVSDDEGSLDRDAGDAIAQIHERKYYLGMKGKVILIGLAFWGKVPKARTEVLSL